MENEIVVAPLEEAEETDDRTAMALARDVLTDLGQGAEQTETEGGNLAVGGAPDSAQEDVDLFEYIDERLARRERLAAARADLGLLRHSKRVMINSFEKRGPMKLWLLQRRSLFVTGTKTEPVTDPLERRQWLEKLLRIDRKIGKLERERDVLRGRQAG